MTTDDLIGQKIGGYEVLEHIGQGGMATVYKARQTSMNRVVALKMLPKHFLRDDMYLKRFEREVDIIAQLEHRNIVPVYDYGQFEGQPFIIMRYLSGGSIDEKLQAHGRLDAKAALEIIEQIAPALDYAHAKNVLHRDLKPSNILIDDDGGAYLTDFGIARIVGSEAQGNTITTTGVVGTPSYMSPEQAQGKTLDARSDVYSLGIMLFEMLTGRRPFNNETPYSIAVMQVTTPPPAPRSINPEISEAVEKVVLQALKKQPENRYASTVELADNLRLAIESPHSLSDTEPRSHIQQDRLQSAMEATQRAEPQYTVPSTPANPQGAPKSGTYRPPVNTPPPSQIDPRRVPPRRRRGNFWVSMIVGSIIGCGLLLGIIFAALMAADEFFSPEETTTPTPTVTAAVQEGTRTGNNADGTATASTLETLDPVSEAAREDLLGIGTVTPGPTSTTRPGQYDAQTGILLYFTLTIPEDPDSFNIYTYNLETGRRRQITSSNGTTFYPELSPDGTRIAYASYQDGEYEIYVQDLDSGAQDQITFNTVDDNIPGWSPDGEWIIYSSDTRQDFRYDIYRVPAEGGEPELLIRNGQRNNHPRYSPDGEYLVFTTGEPGDGGTWEIGLYEFATGEITTLTNNDVRDASPSFSPDGETVIFTTDNSTDVATIDFETRERQVLYRGDDLITGVSYSPDGEYIIFDTDPIDDVPIVYVMQADGDGLQPVDLDDEVGGFFAAWLP